MLEPVDPDADGDGRALAYRSQRHHPLLHRLEPVEEAPAVPGQERRGLSDPGWQREDQVLRRLSPRVDRQQAEPAADQVRAGVWNDAKRTYSHRVQGGGRAVSDD